ncbi:MAG: heavy metal transporter [Flavobacteriaceae bacterium]|nr:heavy metal transporter [Flavobacteriaceae bacterium]
MKYTIITLLAFFCMTTTMVAQEGTDQYEIQVDGLGCPFCAYGLEKKFKEFDGIKNVAIEIETGDFTFTLPSEANLSMEAVEAQVVKAGYTPITTKITRADGTIESSETTTMIADNATLTDKNISVAGKCEMCKARIEKAAKGIPGVAEAVWSVEEKTLMVSYDANNVTPQTIEKAVAGVGHDTQNVKALASTYENLPACCKYERLEQ